MSWWTRIASQRIRTNNDDNFARAQFFSFFFQFLFSIYSVLWCKWMAEINFGSNIGCQLLESCGDIFSPILAFLGFSGFLAGFRVFLEFVELFHVKQLQMQNASFYSNHLKDYLILYVCHFSKLANKNSIKKITEAV